MPKPNKTWKSSEARVAKAFGTRRNPLSGINSGITSSDTRHPTLFLETKHKKNGHAVQRIYNKAADLAKKENKTPLVCLTGDKQKGFLVVCHVKDIPTIAGCLVDGTQQVLQQLEQDVWSQQFPASHE